MPNMPTPSAIPTVPTVQTTRNFDIAIAGGGMVGALAANLLGQAGLSVVVIERAGAEQQTFCEHPSLRTSAFNRFSIELLQQLGAWQQIKESRKAPYVGLETWEHSDNPLSFAAEDVGADFLGHILENDQVQQALWQQFRQHNVQVCTPAQIKTIDRHCEQVLLTLDNGEILTAQLLIGADGANSTVRRLVGIGTEGWQYQQHCMAITVEMAQIQPAVTWQQFHPTGPRAFLPLYGNYASLIWYDSASRIEQLMKLSSSLLQQQIQQSFPARLSDFKILERGSFPLTRMHAKSYYSERTVLIGDAAHTINPLAGQGVNLGFKDAKALATEIIDAFNANRPYWHTATLHRYQQARYKHNLLMMTMMDACYLSFSNHSTPLAKLRNLGLTLANRATPIKNQVLKYAMGL